MPPSLHVVLYQPEIPYNTGNAGRTCLALGGKLWLVRPLGFQLDDRSVRRSGMDYWQHVPHEVVDDWPALMERLSGRRFWFLTKTAAQPYTDARFDVGDVLVFGSESQGLPPSLLEGSADRCLRIPTSPLVRSLNLAVCVGIVAYEAVRQLRERGALSLS
jgi:tRNA (cytidine/uridine-2'-O-)-methyltransferase